MCRPKSDGGLGYRDLRLFNDSLLAKQFWRLHCFPDSLLARSLKARYFPNTSIWEVKGGTNSSYAWRSIRSSRALVEAGVRWKISDGSSVKIWHDAWLGGDGSGKIISPVQSLGPNAMVDVLIDQDSHQWLQDLISAIFLPINVDRILQVPISRRNVPDERVWAASKNGNLRVRDVYHGGLRAKVECSSSIGSDPIWKYMWQLCIPSKAKIFLWRALWDILPHGVNLNKKGVSSVGFCARCGSIENNSHVLRDCDWAKEVWSYFSHSSSRVPPNVSFREWFGMMKEQGDKGMIELFNVLAWQI